MKRLFTSILLLFIITTFGFSNENLFSLISLNTFIEMKNLESIEDSWYFSGFEKSSKQNLKRVSVSLQSNDRNESYILFYNSKGIIEKEELLKRSKYDNIKFDVKVIENGLAKIDIKEFITFCDENYQYLIH